MSHRTSFQLWLVAVLFVLLCLSTQAADAPRRVVNLDGTWQIAEGTLAKMPARFDHTVRVPGLVDLARPAFENAGPRRSLERKSLTREADPRREAFWYRRTFNLPDPLPATVRLKVHKAMFGTAVWVNGQPVGEHAPSFTPGWFDIRSAAKPGRNEIVIRVGASEAQVPMNLCDGHDNEKERYIPGIYDSVEIVLSGTPNIVNVQVAPDIERKQARVRTELKNSGAARTAKLHFTVREWRSGKVVAQTDSEPVALAQNQESAVEVAVSIPNCRLWSPEDPFLYTVEVSTETDAQTARFGMRSFRLEAGKEPGAGRAYLNGKIYYLRGSNVTLYRFFEDAERGALPWDRAWVRKLHRKFKDMHWNAQRYCIGFPPEFWYDIADEEGILIQDEFPIWYSPEWPPTVTADGLVQEYTEWMRERWNHPCVVIWDAQNESRKTEETGKAIQRVRGLDLSNRPWDNGWGRPQAATDCCEEHPYLFNKTNFTIGSLVRQNPVPKGPTPNEKNNAIIINEYDWLWLNRDGMATTLSSNGYRRILGPDNTAAQRRHYYARSLAMLTEFWRAHRKCAGVLYFCTLGYARPDGQTCDNFVNVKKLTFEPEFEKYMRDAFAPVGLMIDEWAEELPAGAAREVPVVVVNDLDQKCQGNVRLRLRREGKVLFDKTQPVQAEPLGTATLRFPLALPAEPGRCQIEAELVPARRGPGAATVRSLREFTVRRPDKP